MPDENTDQLHAKGDDVSLRPEDNADATAALDALFAEAGGGDKPEGDKPEGDKPEGDKPEGDKPEGDKPEGDKPEGDKPEGDKPEGDKPEGDKPEGDAPEGDKPEPDDYDKVQLPPHASQKAKDSFEQLKTTARENQAALKKQLEEHAAKVQELSTQLEQVTAKASVLPENAAEELETLRQFKLAHDVESDPEFRKFDDQLRTNVESIYRKLEDAGLSKKHIEEIKGLGGPGAIDWEPILPRLSLPARRYVEATLVENEKLQYKRADALEGAKKNAREFLTQSAERESGELLGVANQYLAQLPWTAEKPVPPGATPQQRAEIEAQNKFSRETMSQLKTFLSDRSPAKFAELAVGTLIAFKNKRDLEAATAKLEATATERQVKEKELGDKITALTQERDKLKSQLDKIKRAELPRGHGDPVVPPTPVGATITVSGDEALDKLFKEEVARQS